MVTISNILKDINFYCSKNQTSFIPIGDLKYNPNNIKIRKLYSIMIAKKYIEAVGNHNNLIGFSRLPLGTSYFYDRQQRFLSYSAGFISGVLSTVVGAIILGFIN